MIARVTFAERRVSVSRAAVSFAGFLLGLSPVQIAEHCYVTVWVRKVGWMLSWHPVMRVSGGFSVVEQEGLGRGGKIKAITVERYFALENSTTHHGKLYKDYTNAHKVCQNLH